MKLRSPKKRKYVALLVGLMLAGCSVSNTPQPTTTVPTPIELVNAMALSSSGQLLLAGGLLESSPTNNAVYLWDLNQLNRQPTQFLGISGDIYAVAFSPDDKLVAAGTNKNKLILWQLQQPGNPEHTLDATSPVLSLAFSPNGEWLIAGCDDGSIYAWDVHDLEKPGIRVHKHKGPVYSVSISPNSERLASGSQDQTAMLWNISSLINQEPLRVFDQEAAIKAVSFSPDGQSLAVGDYAGTIQLWTLDQPSMPPNTITSQPTGAVPNAYSTEHAVRTLAFSKDGHYLVSGSSDFAVRLYALSTANTSPVVIGQHLAQVNAVVFARNDKSVISTGDDGTLRFWDLGWNLRPQVTGTP